ncbi:MAG: ABC transporter substrate-binding protein [Peptococcaceae bacterium]|nr:ABC transporter substrate-binding protein [Peptococcaceae bacterium]
MKKSLCMILAIFLVLAPLGGCGDSGTTQGSAGTPAAGGMSGEGERVPITMWFWAAAPFQRDAFQAHLVDAFNNSQDEYELILEFQEGVDDNISVALSADQGPDIVYGSGPAFVGGFAGGGKLANLDKYAEKYGWADRLLSPFYDACTVDGSLYSIPGGLTSTGYCFNQKVLDDNGWTLPTTEAELVSILDQAQELGMYSALTGGKDWRPTNELFVNIFLAHYAGPEVVYQCLTGERPWNNEYVIEALKMCDDWYQKGYFAGDDYWNLDYSEAAQLFVNERSPFWFGPTLLFQFIQREADPSQTGGIKFANFPNFREGLPDPVYDIGAVCSYSINAASKNPDGAAMVLDMMLTPEFAGNMSKAWAGYWGIPIRDLSNIDMSGAGALNLNYLEACFEIVETVDNGNFSYNAATFFPASTFQRVIDIDTVWEGVATVEELVVEIDAAYKDDVDAKLVPSIPRTGR